MTRARESGPKKVQEGKMALIDGLQKGFAGKGISV